MDPLGLQVFYGLKPGLPHCFPGIASMHSASSPGCGLPKDLEIKHQTDRFWSRFHLRSPCRPLYKPGLSSGTSTSWFCCVG